MRIASYNIRKGGSRRRRAIAEVVTALDADLTLLQEASDPQVVAWLANATDNAFWTSRPGHSVGLLARHRPDDVRWHVMGMGRTFLEVVLPSSVRLLGLHLSSGLSRRGERRRLAELAAVLQVAGDESARARTLIMGDFNSIAPGDSLAVATLPAWIRLLLRLDGGIQTEVIASVRAAGFVDAYRRFDAKDGATLPSVSPVVRLDYAMVGEGIQDAVASCSIGDVDRSLLATASDHLPLLTVLDLDRIEPPQTGAADVRTRTRPGLEREGRPGLDQIDGAIGDASLPST